MADTQVPDNAPASGPQDSPRLVADNDGLVAVNALYCQEAGGTPDRRLPVSLLLSPSE